MSHIFKSRDQVREISTGKVGVVDSADYATKVWVYFGRKPDGVGHDLRLVQVSDLEMVKMKHWDTQHYVDWLEKLRVSVRQNAAMKAAKAKLDLDSDAHRKLWALERKYSEVLV